jgi:hypothetical protein
MVYIMCNGLSVIVDFSRAIDIDRFIPDQVVLFFITELRQAFLGCACLISLRKGVESGYIVLFEVVFEAWLELIFGAWFEVLLECGNLSDSGRKELKYQALHFSISESVHINRA